MKTTFFLCLALVAVGATAQNKSLYSFQELSHSFYKKQKDSIRKAWECPSIYSNRETQKKFKEIWEGRTAFLLNAIDNNNFVHDNHLLPYVYDIVNQVRSANKELIPVTPFLLLDRSSAVNAYAVGGNVIVVNLGLLSFVQSREELALIVAHELSHNILQHAENAMRKQAELMTSDEYKKSLSEVLDSKYERYSRLTKVIENYKFDRSKHQRYKESDADSLAIVLLRNTKIPFDATAFLRLDSADNEYRRSLKLDVKNYFTAYNLPFEDGWTKKRSKGLSTKSYNFKDTTHLHDSLKTHPDCVERFERTKKYSTEPKLKTAISPEFTAAASKMIIWNLFSNNSLTQCLYRTLLAKDRSGGDPWFDFMVNNVFAGLYYNDRELKRFKSIGVTQKELVSVHYFELQTMLEQIPRETIFQYCKQLQDQRFWNNMNADEKALKQLMQTLAVEERTEDIARTAKDFSARNPSSMYCELAGYFFK